MISTDINQTMRRLPPVSGLLDDMLDQAIRTRHRRVLVADNPNANLSALRVSDQALDQAILSAALYGRDAALQLDQRILSATGATADAAVFLRVAVAIQMRSDDVLTLAARYVDQHTVSVRDAFWFYPVPDSSFADDSRHIVKLFEYSEDHSALRRLAIELTGRRDVKVLQSSLEALTKHVDFEAEAHFALTCMGAANQRTAHFVEDASDTAKAAERQHVFDMIAADPRLIDDALLAHCLRMPSETSELAWAVAACRHPRQTFEQTKSTKDIAENLRLRITALTGYMDGVVLACADMANTEGPISAEQASLLALVFGTVPVEVRQEPNQADEKSKALRTLVLQACRRAHIAVHNDADCCSWDAASILLNPQDSPRIRGGERMSLPVPPFQASVSEVTHALRQWLYIERAAAAQTAFPLSARDVSRRQELALMVAEAADELSAQ